MLHRISLIALATAILSGAMNAKQRIVNYPSYETKSSAVLSVRSIELTDTATRLNLHAVYKPGWWIEVKNTAALADPASGTTYPLTRAEGITPDERFTMPESGSADFTLVYPPIPEGLRIIDFDPEDYRILGIRLDGKKAAGKVQVDTKKWISANNKTASRLPDVFFREGICRLSGRIDGYSPRKTETKNLLAYVPGPFGTGETPTAIDIDNTGAFQADIPIGSPVRIKISVDKNVYFNVYAEPGQDLALLLDDADITRFPLDRLMGKTQHYTPKAFGGSLGEVNRELAAAPKPEHEYLDDLWKTTVPSEAINRINEWNDKYREALSSYKNANTLNPVTVKLLDADSRLYVPALVMDYTRYIDNAMIKGDKDLPSLKEPKTISFYRSLRELLRDDNPWLLAGNDIGVVLNRLAFSDIFDDAGVEANLMKLEVRGDLIAYLISKNATLTPEEQTWANYISENKGKTLSMTWNELVEFNKWGNSPRIAERNGMEEELKAYRDSAKAYDMTLTQDDEVTSINRKSQYIRLFARTDSVPFVWQAATASYLCHSNGINPEFEKKEAAFDKIQKLEEAGILSHPSARAAVRNHFEEVYSHLTYRLPDDERGEIVRRLIEPHKGKYVLLDLWATTCGPCRANIINSAKMRAANREHPDFVTIFITGENESPKEAYDSFVAENLAGEAVHRIPQDDFNRLRDLFKFSAIPRYVLIDREGRVVNDNQNFDNLQKTLSDLDVILN